MAKNERHHKTIVARFGQHGKYQDIVISMEREGLNSHRLIM